MPKKKKSPAPATVPTTIASPSSQILPKESIGTSFLHHFSTLSENYNPLNYNNGNNIIDIGRRIFQEYINTNLQTSLQPGNGQNQETARSNVLHQLESLNNSLKSITNDPHHLTSQLLFTLFKSIILEISESSIFHRKSANKECLVSDDISKEIQALANYLLSNAKEPFISSNSATLILDFLISQRKFDDAAQFITNHQLRLQELPKQMVTFIQTQIPHHAYKYVQLADPLLAIQYHIGNLLNLFSGEKKQLELVKLVFVRKVDDALQELLSDPLLQRFAELKTYYLMKVRLISELEERFDKLSELNVKTFNSEIKIESSGIRNQLATELELRKKRPNSHDVQHFLIPHLAPSMYFIYAEITGYIDANSNSFLTKMNGAETNLTILWSCLIELNHALNEVLHIFSCSPSFVHRFRLESASYLESINDILFTLIRSNIITHLSVVNLIYYISHYNRPHITTGLLEEYVSEKYLDEIKEHLLKPDVLSPENIHICLNFYAAALFCKMKSGSSYLALLQNEWVSAIRALWKHYLVKPLDYRIPGNLTRCHLMGSQNV